MRPRGSVISRVLIAFCAIAVLIGVAAVIGYTGLARQNSAARELTSRDYVLQQAAGRMQNDFTTSQLSVNSFALSGSSASLSPLPSARADFAVELAALQAHAPGNLSGMVATQAQDGARLFALAGTITGLPPGSQAERTLAGQAGTISRAFYMANSAMQESLAAQVRQLTAESKHALSDGLARSAAAIAIAVLLILVAAFSTVRGITEPLRGLTATVRKLTSGDHAARATVTGSAEVREVAGAVNAMAEENDRLRAQELEHAQLRALARQAGIRVRAHSEAEDVLREASAAITRCVQADLAVMRLVEEQNPRYAGSAREDWLPVSFPRDLSPHFYEWAGALLAKQSSTVIQDVRGKEGDKLPPGIREPLLRQGVVAHMATPFGIGSELLGVVELERVQPGHPWTAAEVDAIQSIAADLGRGLTQTRLHEDGDRLVEQAQTLNQAKSDFFVTVSHELRTPLTSIEGYVEMLRDEDGGQITAAQERMLETIGRSAARLRNLIEDLFTLSKIESGAFQALLRPVDLMDIIRDAVQLTEPSVAGTGLTLTVTGPDKSLIVNGDVGQLDRVVMNLLSNATKFTPPGGQVRVTTARDGDAAVISVSDTGIGVPAKDKAALFGRFFRASNAIRRSIPGTGLGLTIVSTIVTDHGGYVDIQSTEGVGTTVTVRLPLLPVAAIAALTGAEPRSPVPLAATGSLARL